MMKTAIYARLAMSGYFDFRKCFETIVENNGALVESFIDISQDGYSYDRPEYNRLKKSVNEGKLDYVVVPSLLQFSRNLSGILEEITFLKTRGVRVFFCDIDMDSDEIDETSESFKKVLDAALDSAQNETFGKNDVLEDEVHAKKEHIEDYIDDFQVVDKKCFS